MFNPINLMLHPINLMLHRRYLILSTQNHMLCPVNLMLDPSYLTFPTTTPKKALASMEDVEPYFLLLNCCITAIH